MNDKLCPMCGQPMTKRVIWTCENDDCDYIDDETPPFDDEPYDPLLSATLGLIDDEAADE